MLWWKKTSQLDKPLFKWDKKNALTVRNLLAGGIHAFGRTDGGKTSSIIQIIRAILRYCNSSLLILCSKQDEYLVWLAEARKAGRARDVVLIDAKQAWRLNMIGWEAMRGGEGAGQAQNITRFIMEIRNVVFRESEQSGGDSQQWKKQDERLITFAIVLLLLGGQPVTPTNLQELILSAPHSPAQLRDEEWQRSYCNQCIAAAFHKNKTSQQQGDFTAAADYFTREWPSMADRTRSSIVTGTTATLFAMNLGVVRELFATDTNISLTDLIETRKIVIVNMPPDEWGDSGSVANIGLKFLWQKEVLRRRITDKSPIACILGDESSIWATPFDAAFLSRCRSYRGCMIYLCQSLNAYRDALPGDKAEAAIKSMLANFSHKLFFALGDYETAEFASNLCGKEMRQFTGGGMQRAPYDPLAMIREQGQYSSNFHEQYTEVIQPGEFMNGLRTGSPVNGYKVDAVLVRSGVPFSNGLPLLDVTFDQRR